MSASVIVSSEKKLHFMCWNLNGLKKYREEKKSEIKKYDVVFLQETHSGESEVLEMLEDYKSFYTTQTSSVTGVAILIKTNIFEETDCTVQKDPAGCYILVKCSLKEQLFTLVSVYNCQSNIEPLLKLRSVLEKHAEGILLIGGDFNVPLNPYLDRTSTKKNKHHSLYRPVVEELMSSFNLVDVWRRLHPKQRQYSYQQNNVKSRLDYIFVTDESMQYIEECYIAPHKSCFDHNPVVVEICMSQDDTWTPECLDISSDSETHVSSFQDFVVDHWLICKRKYWLTLDLSINPHTSLMISAGEVERAIQSLVVNDVKRPDGLPLSFYKKYSYVLIPYLCAFYHKLLQQPMDIPNTFNERIKVSKIHYIYNVDYLIFTSIMAGWLYDHLQVHSADYTAGDDKLKTDEIKTVLISFKKRPQYVEVTWSLLRAILRKENETNPPLVDTFKIGILGKILKNCPKREYKLLQWGCPLTPVLLTLCLKHIALEMVESLKGQTPSIYISRENVTVRFAAQHDLENLKEKYNTIKFKPLRFCQT